MGPDNITPSFNPGLLGAGIATAGAGAIVQGIGESIGSKAAQQARLRHLAEQQAYNAAGEQATNQFLAQSSRQGQDMLQHMSAANEPVQSKLAQLGGLNGMSDISGVAGEAAFNTAQQGNEAASAAFANEAAQRGLSQQQQTQHNRLSDLTFAKNSLEAEAKRRAQLYDMDIAAEAGRGIGLRNLGKLGTGVGTGLMQLGPSLAAAEALKNRPQYTLP